MLALAAFAFATSGFSNEAHAAFTVRLDKSSNPSSAVTWAGTTNLISVCVVLNGIDPNCWPVDTARALIARTNHDFFSLFFEHMTSRPSA